MEQRQNNIQVSVIYHWPLNRNFLTAPVCVSTGNGLFHRLPAVRCEHGESICEPTEVLVFAVIWILKCFKYHLPLHRVNALRATQLGRHKCFTGWSDHCSVQSQPVQSLLVPQSSEYEPSRINAPSERAESQWGFLQVPTHLWKRQNVPRVIKTEYYHY